MKKEEYCFDGTAKVLCRKCKVLHEVAFDGTDLDTCVEDAIERGMNEAGWETVNHLCPNCWDEYEESDEAEDGPDIDFEYDMELDDDFDDYDDNLDEEE
jgi:hypothetical protein